MKPPIPAPRSAGEPATPAEKFGRDHNSTLLYLETRWVDGDGSIAFDKMRTNPKRHPHYRGPVNRLMGWDEKYATRLADGETIPGHDDWDCIDDMIAAGLLDDIGSGINPRFRLTDAGWRAAHALRRALAEKRNQTFAAPATPTYSSSGRGR